MGLSATEIGGFVVGAATLVGSVAAVVALIRNRPNAPPRPEVGLTAIFTSGQIDVYGRIAQPYLECELTITIAKGSQVEILSVAAPTGFRLSLLEDGPAKALAREIQPEMNFVGPGSDNWTVKFWVFPVLELPFGRPPLSRFELVVWLRERSPHPRTMRFRLAPGITEFN